MTSFLPDLVSVKGAALFIVVTLYTIYKKEILDWLKESLANFKKWALGWLRRWLAPPARRLPDSELKAILDAGLEVLDTYLCLLQKEYGADRVTVTEYEEQDDGGAFVTCLVEVRTANIRSVRNLKQTPMPPPLWAQVKQIGTQFPGRVRIVSDARVEANAVLRAALLSSGAWSTYYEMMPDETGEYKKCRLLALSWHAEYPFTPAQLLALHSSAYGCYMALLMMEQVKTVSKA